MTAIEHIAVLAALTAELGDPAALQEGPYPFRITTAVSGVGKVAAARETTRLILGGADLILVVGTCGGLAPSDRVGDLIHLGTAIQWDLSVRDGRETRADPDVSALWQELAPGRLGAALTADRPALDWMSRARRARAFARSASPGHGALTPVADMETAAVAATAASFGIPWAGLRVISDARRSVGDVLRGRSRSDGSFKANFQRVAGQPAATLPPFMAGLARRRD